MLNKMHTQVSRVMPAIVRVASDPIAAIRSAVAALKAGSVIGVPTDTIYGLAVSAQHDSGIQLLYNIKERDESKPVAICVSKVADIHHWGETSHLPQGLLDALLPGPVTVVLTRTFKLNHALNPGNPLVGIRVPDDNFIRNVCSGFGNPIALTSANRSCGISSLTIFEFQELWPCLGCVYDGGQLPGSRSGSTVVDLSVRHKYTIVRAGSALKETITKLQEFGLEHSN